MAVQPVLTIACISDVSTRDVLASRVWREERLHSQRDRASLNNLRISRTDTNDLQLITRIRRQHMLVMSVILPLSTRPDFSVPFSQKPSNTTFLQPRESNPRLRILLLNIHFNIILPSTPNSSKLPLSCRISNRNPARIFILHMRATHTIHYILHTSSNNYSIITPTTAHI